MKEESWETDASRARRAYLATSTALLVVVGALLACSSSHTPDSVCDHAVELRKKSGKVKDGEEAEAKNDCLGSVKKIEKDLGEEGFQKFAECATSKSDEKAMRTECDPKDFKK